MGFAIGILTVILLYGIPTCHRLNATALGVVRHWERHIVWLPILLCAFASAVQAVLNDLLLHFGGKGRAQQILNSQQHNPDLFAQHIISAQSSLKIFAEGPLHGAGAGADITHEEILRDNWIVCIVSPTQYLDRLGPWFASHFNSFMDIQMTGTVGKTDFIIDEYCSGPFEPALKRITVQRIFGSRLILITQSRRDSIRRYGEDFTAVLEENSLVLQILKITQFEEAERISKSMGETRVVTASLGTNNKDQSLQTTFNTSKERHFSPAELMALPENEQVILIPGVGWIHCLKLGQHEIGPYRSV